MWAKRPSGVMMPKVRNQRCRPTQLNAEALEQPAEPVSLASSSRSTSSRNLRSSVQNTSHLTSRAPKMPGVCSRMNMQRSASLTSEVVQEQCALRVANMQAAQPASNTLVATGAIPSTSTAATPATTRSSASRSPLTRSNRISTGRFLRTNQAQRTSDEGRGTRSRAVRSNSSKGASVVNTPSHSSSSDSKRMTVGTRRSASLQSGGSTMLLRAAAKKLPVSCKYANVGCTEMVVAAEQDKHARICEFRPYECPVKSCRWKVNMDDLVSHLQEFHPNIDQQKGPCVEIKITDITQPAPVEWCTVQTCLGKQFLVIMQKLVGSVRPEFFGTVKILGHKEDADRFSFTMDLRHPKKKMSYTADVCPLRSTTEHIVKRDCLVFGTDVAESFSTDKNLSLEVGISMS